MQDLTPRTLIRARDLAAFRDALVALGTAGAATGVVRRALVVPTRAAAELLRQTIEARLDAAHPAALLPALLTRDEWLARLHDALPHRRRLLSRTERQILFERAARRTAARPRMGGAPFQLRPGLIGALLEFYDELGRRQRHVRRFARVLFEQLRVERGTDRGSESLVHETAFMGLTFLAYERAVADSGGIDEHGLRRELLANQPALPFDHIVVAVADHPSDPRGLWPADFDLIGRLRGIARLDVVVTDETHDAGFRERVERELPGIVERRHEIVRTPAAYVRPDAPAPPTGEPRLCFISRDREEELRAAARMIRTRAEADDGVLKESAAIVFHRPLPYVYLAHQVLTEEGLPYEAFDALPLAAEPYAAMLDLVLTFARSGGTREAAAALLRCSLLRFVVDDVAVVREDVTSLVNVLATRRATGEADTYAAEVQVWFGDRSTRDRASKRRAERAARAAAGIRAELNPYRTAASASAQVRALSSFIRHHEVHPHRNDVWRARHLRARAAVLAVLDELAAAYEAHDDRARDDAAVTAAIRHAIEAQVFTPRRGAGGVRLVDAAAARFGEFDHVHLVGLVESDWPERARRSIFFTSGLLKTLGWPQEPDELRAQQAAFRDLLHLSARTTTLHAFELEGEARTAVSPILVAIGSRYDGTRYDGTRYDGTRYDGTHDVAPPGGTVFAALRRQRPPLADTRYSGYVPPREPTAYRVSAIDRYVDCPFRYFAETILQLPDERDEMAGLTPLERGTLVHDLFERFYKTWDARGAGTITPATLPDALTLFAGLARDALAPLPEADRALEETRLLGSIVARGLAERVFELEADAGGRVVRRLIEYDLRGSFEFPTLHGLAQKTVDIRAKADRIDVFDDGTLRVIDYKLTALPDLETSVQIGVYAHAARQRLERAEGRSFTIGSAMYLAFGDDRRLEGRLGTRDMPPGVAVLARAADFASHVERIEAGEFPPRPRRPSECQWCGVAGVCRKEYAAPDEAADPV